MNIMFLGLITPLQQQLGYNFQVPHPRPLKPGSRREPGASRGASRAEVTGTEVTGDRRQPEVVQGELHKIQRLRLGNKGKENKTLTV